MYRNSISAIRGLTHFQIRVHFFGERHEKNFAVRSLDLE
jgi:hypothetical protein